MLPCRCQYLGDSLIVVIIPFPAHWIQAVGSIVATVEGCESEDIPWRKDRYHHRGSGGCEEGRHDTTTGAVGGVCGEKT